MLSPVIVGQDWALPLFAEQAADVPAWQKYTPAEVKALAVNYPDKWKLLQTSLKSDLRRLSNRHGGKATPEKTRVQTLLLAGRNAVRDAEAKRKHGKRWKTGGSDHSLQGLEDFGRSVLESPVTRGALTAASFTPLAPIAAPAAAGLAAYDMFGGLGDGLDWSDAANLAQAGLGFVPGGGQAAQYVGQAVQVGRGVEQVSRGDYLGALGTASNVAGAFGAPVPKQASQALGYARQAAPIAQSVQRGDYLGAAQQAGRFGRSLEVPIPKQAERYARQAAPIAGAVQRGDYLGAAQRAAGLHSKTAPVGRLIGQGREVYKQVPKGIKASQLPAAGKAALRGLGGMFGRLF